MFNIFNNNVSTKDTTPNMSDSQFQILQNARKDLVGEIQAIIDYDNHIHTSNIAIATETWEDIRNEELVHVGELLAMLNYLAPYQQQYVAEGYNEFTNRLNNAPKM